MSWRKGSTGSNDTSAGSGGSRGGGPTKPVYPFALALRIRVVQIVCGIAEVVMGSVAAIEERGQLNLSLGVPAGAMVVLAAAWSVHRSVHRNAGGRRGGACWSRALWCIACSLQLSLLFLAVKTAVNRQHHGEDHTSNTSLAVAGVQGVLSSCALSACLAAGRVRCVYGRAPPLPPLRNNNCPRSTSHTAVSMVPMTCNYSYPAAPSDANKCADTLSSENEMIEISLGDKPSGDRELSPGVKSVQPQDPLGKLATYQEELFSPNACERDSSTKNNGTSPFKEKKSENIQADKDHVIQKAVNSVDFSKNVNYIENSNINNTHTKINKILM